jgi:hypothetical protein
MWLPIFLLSCLPDVSGSRSGRGPAYKSRTREPAVKNDPKSITIHHRQQQSCVRTNLARHFSSSIKVLLRIDVMSGFTHRKWRVSFGNRISRSMTFCQHNLAIGVKKQSGYTSLFALFPPPIRRRGQVVDLPSPSDRRCHPALVGAAMRPSCRIMPRSSRTARCSMALPSLKRTKCMWACSKERPVGGMP